MAQEMGAAARPAPPEAVSGKALLPLTQTLARTSANYRASAAETRLSSSCLPPGGFCCYCSRETAGAQVLPSQGGASYATQA